MNKKPRTPQARPAATPSPGWLALHPDLSALLIFSVLVAIFFFDVLFSAKTFFAPDAQTPSALTLPLRESWRTTGTMPLWSPQVFCGMPSFGSVLFVPIVYFPAVIFEWIRRLVPLREIVFHLLHYVLAGMGTYLLLRRRGISFGPAVFAGMAFMFMPYLITMEVFGHGSQMMTTAYLPLAFWAVDRLFDKRDLLSLGLAGLLLGLQLQRSHVQISYYILMLLGAFWLYSVIQRWRLQQSNQIVPMTLYFAGALALAAALGAILYLPIKEYTPFSIRGAQSVLAQGATDSGVGFAYATEWSFSPGEMMTFLLPSFFGFGGQTYWGTMPFTDYPNYMGIAVLALAIVAVVWRRPLAGFLGIVAVVALLISFGKHFSPVYQLLYNLLPYFNKFRVPVMILVLVQFAVVVMAGIAFEAILDALRSRKREQEAVHRTLSGRLFLVAAGLVAFALVISVARGAAAPAMNGLYPDRYAPEVQQQVDALRFRMLLGDVWMLALVLGGSLCLFALALRKTIGSSALIGGMCCLSLVDLWVVDYRLNKPQPARSRETYLAADDAAQFLKADTSLFRIFPVQQLFGENRWAAQGLQSVGGYHAAKPRAYQDLLDASGLGTEFINKYVRVVTHEGRQALEYLPVEEIPAQARQRDLWLLDLLNVKYVLSFYLINEPNFALRTQAAFDYHGQAVALAIYENLACLPRPFLVGAYEHIPQPREALARLLSGDLNPHHAVILDTPPELAPAADSTARATVVSYAMNDIVVQTETRAPQLLVLSDNYYPVGWSAYLDGLPVPSYRANYCFRAVSVPPGAHRIHFRMRSPGYSTGLWITGSGLIIVAGLIGLGWWREQNRPRSSAAEKATSSSHAQRPT